MDTIWIDRTEIATLGMRLTRIDPWLDGPALTRAATPFPNRSGHVVSRTATAAPRIFRFESLVRPATMAARRALLDDLADFFGRGEHEIETVDSLGRVLYGTYQEQPVGIAAPRFVNTDAAVTVDLYCADGTKYDREPRSVALSTTPAPVPLGTMASGGVIRLRGPSSDQRIVTYRGLHGNPLGRLAVGLSIGANEFVDLDLYSRTITKTDVNGLTIDIYDTKLPDTWWFWVHPEDGDRFTGQWGTLEVDDGTGVFYYRRAWKN